MTALANCLRTNGQSITIVSAFEGLDSLAAANCRLDQLRGYELVKVPVESSVVLKFLVRVKRLLRELRAGPSTSNQTAKRQTSAQAGNPAQSRSSWIRQAFFAVLHLIDDKKRWSLQAMRRIISASAPAVIIASGPPMSSLLGAILAGRRLGIPVVVDLRDPIWMETDQGTPDHSFQLQWGRRALERFVLQRATYVTTTSPSLCARLQARYPEIVDRIACIYNGFDEEPLAQRSNTARKLVIVYAGTLYLNRDPFPFLEAVGHLLSRRDVDASRVEVLFAGDCERYREISLRQWLADHSWGGAVTIYPFLEAQELKQLYGRATLLLNFAEGQRMQVPAKTFELLALGRELLVLCEPDSDTATLVHGITGVSCAQSRDVAAMRDLLLDVYRRHVLDGTVRAPLPRDICEYSRSAQNNRFVAVIEKVRLGVSDRPPSAVGC